MLGRTVTEKTEDYLLLIKAKAMKEALENTKEQLDPAQNEKTIKFINQQLEVVNNAISAFNKLEHLDSSLYLEEEMLNNDIN